MTWFLAFLGRVPRQVWIGIGSALLLAGLIWLHQHKAHQAITAAEKRGEDRAYARVEAKAIKLAKDAAAISAKARSLNNETNRRIAADADHLRVRGPGRAACLNPVTPSSGRYVAPVGKPDVAGPDLPTADGEALLAAVPWPWLVDRAEQCDLNRAEAETWRAWHKALNGAWAKDK